MFIVYCLLFIAIARAGIAIARVGITIARVVGIVLKILQHSITLQHLCSLVDSKFNCQIFFKIKDTKCKIRFFPAIQTTIQVQYKCNTNNNTSAKLDLLVNGGISACFKEID